MEDHIGEMGNDWRERSWVGKTDKGSEYQRGGEHRDLIQITMYSSSSHIVTPGCRAPSIPGTSEATRMVGDQPFLSDGFCMFFCQFIRNALAGVFRTAEGSGKNNGFRATHRLVPFLGRVL